MEDSMPLSPCGTGMRSFRAGSMQIEAVKQPWPTFGVASDAAFVVQDASLPLQHPHGNARPSVRALESVFDHLRGDRNTLSQLTPA